ncbi:MAG: glucose-1-phosphate thymidylyltransferase [Bacteroidales bacterium]|nr:glucose-1-phosphate thymidylyltransferase [Bacteroidales bacterium]
MKNIVLSDTGLHKNLLPLSYTRPVAEMRTGIFTNAERWEKLSSIKPNYQTEKYLSIKHPNANSEKALVINGSVIADKELANAALNLKKGSLVKNNKPIAAIKNSPDFNFDILPEPIIEYKSEVIFIENTYDIFSYAGHCLSIDFELITQNRTSQKISSTNTVFGKHPLFIEEGVKIEAAIINTNNGPVYLGKNSEVMEGSMIRGPFALGENSQVKMGAKIYGPTIIGPHSRVGGELNNIVVFGFSNKAHDGFLGNSVIGEWCNLGADTNNSNLKNNYVKVKLWNYEHERFTNTDLQFCGLIMGDHSKTGINTMFNTGTVVGVSANIFGDGFPRNFIPSYSWGGANGFQTFKLENAFEVAEVVMKRRDLNFSEEDKDILSHIFEISKTYRKF